MIDTIYIAMSGLYGYEKGLKVIANNTANLNTPGFKGSTIQFADLFYSTQGGGSGLSEYGYGLNTLGKSVGFQQGQTQSTGNALDLAVNGQGMFVLRDAAGQLHYTRDGQFKFNSDGVLVSSATGEEVMAFQDDGTLAPISIADVKLQVAKATTTVSFAGILTTASASDVVSNVTVIDASGGSHALSVRLDADAANPGTWTVTLLDGTTTVGTGQIVFINGMPDPANSKVSLTYTPAGQDPIPLTLDFSTNVTSYEAGTTSSLALAQQDGYAPGTLTGTSFDADGTLELAYSSGHKAKGARLALATFSSPDDVESVGDNEYVSKSGRGWVLGHAADQGFGALEAGSLEMSNVDLSQEFSNLVIMQRGYQASSQVVSTANEMLTALFGMQGK